jgi:hypothetical protein
LGSEYLLNSGKMSEMNMHFSRPLAALSS